MANGVLSDVEHGLHQDFL